MPKTSINSSLHPASQGQSLSCLSVLNEHADTVSQCVSFGG